VYELMPVAVLIGALYALSALAGIPKLPYCAHRGCRRRTSCFQLFQVAAVIALLTFVVGEVVARRANECRAAVAADSKGEGGGQELRSGFWVKDERRFINVQTVLPDTRLKGIRFTTSTRTPTCAR
jgi:lipopolysaccharide export system permease protein